MFQLRRYFSVAGLIAFVFVTILLAVLYRSVALRMFLALEEDKNVELTQSFANSLWPKLQPFIAISEASNHASLRDLVFITELRQAVVTQMHGLSVVKIKVYDLDGDTIFSTQLDQIGDESNTNAGFQRALRGEVASELTHRDTFSAFEETIENQDLLSTYIPIYANGPTSPVVGVFELYSNVTPFLQQISSTQRQLIIGVSITLALLYLVLLWVVSRADAMIRRQHQAQLVAAEEIRRQHRAVAVLQEREHLARELHDSLGQVLGYVNTQAQAARSLLRKDNSAEVDRLLARLVTVAQDAHVELRAFILKLQTGERNGQPFLLRLKTYLEQFQHYAELRTHLNVAPEHHELDFPPAIGDNLFRIVQEALNNIQKHAAAQTVTVDIALANQHLAIAIVDDGRGFSMADATDLQGHWGLKNMQQRAIEIGARFEISSCPGQGTKVTLYVPYIPALPLVNTLHQPSIAGRAHSPIAPKALPSITS